MEQQLTSFSTSLEEYAQKNGKKIKDIINEEGFSQGHFFPQDAKLPLNNQFQIPFNINPLIKWKERTWSECGDSRYDIMINDIITVYGEIRDHNTQTMGNVDTVGNFSLVLNYFPRKNCTLSSVTIYGYGVEHVKKQFEIWVEKQYKILGDKIALLYNIPIGTNTRKPLKLSLKNKMKRKIIKLILPL